MTRREIRDSAFKLIFETLFRDDQIEELYAICEEIDEITVSDEVKEIVEGVLAHADELDAIIAKYSAKRALSRIAKVNLAVLRIAFYEIIYDEGTPINAAINEAVLLSVNYSQESDTAFVNGVLGSYARDHAEKTADV